MEQNVIHQLIKNFESVMHTTDDGIEFWLTRELQPLLGYSKRDNFVMN